MIDLESKIFQLEDELLHTNFSKHPRRLDQLLAPSFKEINSDGCIAGHKDVISWLLTKPTSCRWTFLNFSARHIAEDLALAIYQAKRTEETDPNYQGSMHSSVWQCNQDNWQMIFHQSTKIS